MPQSRSGETNHSRDASRTSEIRTSPKGNNPKFSLREGFRKEMYKLDSPKNERINKSLRQDMNHTFATERSQPSFNEIHITSDDIVLEAMADFINHSSDIRGLPKRERLEYAQQHFHHSEHFENLTQKEKDIFLNEIHTASDDTILEAMADFIKDPKNSHMVPIGKELEYVQQHFHHSEYFENLTQKEKDIFLNEIHTASDDTILEAMADFIKDPKNSHMVPIGKELEYAKQHFHHSEHFENLTQREKDIFLNEIHTASDDTILEAMADFIKDPKNSHMVPIGKELEYVQQHFHHSEYFENLTQKEKDIFLNEIHTASDDIVLEAMADFIKDPKNSHMVPIGKELEYAKQHFHHSEHFENLTQREKDIFLNEIHTASDDTILEAMADFIKDPKNSHMVPIGKELEYVQQHFHHSEYFENLTQKEKDIFLNEIHTASDDIVLEAMADFIKDPKNSHMVPIGKELEYAKQHFHHSEHFENLTQREKDIFLNEIHTASDDTILEAMADFIKDPKNSHMVPIGKELEYVQQHFHHSEYFENLTQKEKDIFLNEIHTASDDIVLEAMADFIKDPKNSHMVPIGKELEYAQQHFHHSEHFENLTQKEKDIFLNEIHTASDDTILEAMADFIKDPKNSHMVPIGKELEYVQQHFHHSEYFENLTQKEKDIFLN